MRTPDEVMARHGDNLLDAAVELARRFEGTESFEAAAELWLARASDTGQFLAPGKAHSIDDPALAAATKLVLTATRGMEPFRTWVERATSEQKLMGKWRPDDARPPVGVAYSGPVLSLVVLLWPLRDRLSELPDQVARLRAERIIPVCDAWSAACDLCDYADLAFALLDGPTVKVSSDCDRTPRANTNWERLALVFERRLKKLEPDDREQAILASVAPEEFLSETFSPALMLAWLAEGVPVPPGFWPGVRAASRGDTRQRLLAIRYLCADPDQQPRAVEWLAFAVDKAPSPGDMLSALADRLGLFGRGAFFGRGWPREERSRKLVPLSRALLLRGAWPSKAWSTLLRPPFGWDYPKNRHPAQDEERALVAQQEVLAEALLSFIRDAEAPELVRHRGLDALERLCPGGDGSWARALSTVKHPPQLARRAREVQKALRDSRGARMDVELAIVDAVEIFLGKLVEGQPGGAT